jgi:hypothetical protein
MRSSIRAVSSSFLSCTSYPERRRKLITNFPASRRNSISQGSLVSVITMNWQWKVDELIKQTE